MNSVNKILIEKYREDIVELISSQLRNSLSELVQAKEQEKFFMHIRYILEEQLVEEKTQKLVVLSYPPRAIKILITEISSTVNISRYKAEKVLDNMLENNRFYFPQILQEEYTPLIGDISEILINLHEHSDSSRLMNALIKKTELSVNSLAELFGVTAKTLSRYKKERLKLALRDTELAVKLDILYNLGKEIFGSAKEFNEWLNEKSYGLNDKRPMEFLNTVTGIDLVASELKRIEFGATA